MTPAVGVGVVVTFEVEGKELGSTIIDIGWVGEDYPEYPCNENTFGLTHHIGVEVVLPDGVCGPDNGDCFDPAGNGTPGCDDEACCSRVCEADAHCCGANEGYWCETCAALAAEMCSELCVAPGIQEPPCTTCKECLLTNPGGDCGGRDCGGDTAYGDPVYLFSGECYERAVDLRIRGRMVDFVWARKYRSRIGANSSQGNGWDFSYDIFLEPSGEDLLLHDGDTRVDGYVLQLDGTWTSTGFFRVLTKNADESFTLTFEETGRWNFHPLDGSPQQGKIKSIIDRNGNGLTFDYDGPGRLIAIHDTLDNPPTNPRVITVAYNTDSFIESVTDFAGRSVTYTYYDGIEPGGNFGDLKSVTTPIVVNTAGFPIPPGHEYPSGKTTVYTYSTGFADDRLNHNLLTITDPKGQRYLTTTYSPTQDPTDLNFDRVVRQVWGDPGDIIDYVYVAQCPAPANNFAVLKTVVNDLVGDVKENFFDAFNRNVMHREYTGRWDPDLPTTDADLMNPPIPQLRPSDPPYFETRWEYNADSLPTRMIHPNLNEVVSTYDEANPGRRSQGNKVMRCLVPGPLGGDQVQICETYEYDDNFGGCCGSNFVTRYVDGRGNDTLHTYDANGNRTHTRERIPSIVEDFEYNSFGQMTARTLPDNGAPGGHRRRDEYTYHDAGPQLGYLKDGIVDAPGFALTTTYEYNPVGQVARVTDPRRHDTQYTVNQLDQVVRRISREVVGGGGVRYERQIFYGPNNNVVRVDIQNKDDAGALQANEHFTHVYEYDILNYQTKMCQEVGDYTGAIPGTQQVPLCTGLPDAEFLSTEYGYDANRNRTLTRFGEAVEGRQPNNVVRTLYDERDLVFQQIRAEGDPDQSTTQYDYDPNRNTVRVSQGIEDVAAPRITINTYDGYDRRVTSTDPMANITEYHYDPNSNVGGFQDPAETIPNPFGTRVSGELIDVPGSAGNVRLTQMTSVYDKLDRIIREEVEFFDTDTQTPILISGVPTPGKATTLTEWSDNSQVLRMVNDNNHQTTITYDTANRRGVVADHLNNTSAYAYDDNSNVTARTDVDKSDLGTPDELFTTTYTYDGLDRRTQTVDNVGNTHTYAYDSRDNRTVMTDALSHETRYIYDGINRLTQTIRDLDDNGADGDGPDITTTQAWDDTSRLITQTDDNDNTTTYIFDALDRMTAEHYADTTVHSHTYDVHDNRLTITDANGSVATSAYDLLDRLINKTIAPGPGVSSDTTFEIYRYDGLSRLVHAEDNDSLVTRSYDSLSRVTSETLNDQSTNLQYDGVGNKLTCTYPGGRVIDSEYDELERPKTMTDLGTGSTIAIYDYIGPGRVERREYGNGTRTDFHYDGITGIPNPTNDFGVRAIIGTTHTKIADGTVIDDRTYTWDKMYNKTQRKDVRAGGPQLTHDYTYDDAVYRLVHTTVTGAVAAGGLRATGGAIVNGEGTSDALIWDNYPTGDTDWVSASQLDPVYPFDAQSADDLQFSPGVKITGVHWRGRYWNQNPMVPNTTSFHILFYADNGTGNAPTGGPTDPSDTALAHYNIPIASITVTPNDVGTNRYDYEVTLPSTTGYPDGFVAAEGLKYWIAIQSENLYRPQWGMISSVDQQLRTAVAGYPALGDDYWTDIDNAGVSPDLCFKLTGVPIVRDTDYDLDGVGNRERVTGAPDPGQYTMSDMLTEPADRQMNQYTTTATDPRGYDKNGNLTRIGLADVDGDGLVNLAEYSALATCLQGPGAATPPACKDYDLDANGTVDLADVAHLQNAFGGSAGISYDYRNQMVEYRDLTTGQRHTYAYDAFGRRIARVVNADSAATSNSAFGIPHTAFAAQPRTETRYFYDGWQVCEEQDGAGVPQATYVYGLYIDEVLNMRRGGRDYYYHTDDLYNVVAVTDSTGAVRERHEYADYGSAVDPTALAPVGGDPSALGNPYLFQGRRLDPETGFYYFRNRYYDPQTGRFLQRDPVWDPVNVGNQYTFVGNGPVSRRDAWGLHEIEWESNQTQAQRQMIKDSMARVEKRLKELEKEIDEEIKGLGDKCKYLQKKLWGLKLMFGRIRKEIKSKSHNLEIYTATLMPSARSSYWDGGGTIFDDELTLDPTWFARSNSAQDSDMLHELTHGQGADDGEAGNDFNNSHALDELISHPLAGRVWYKHVKRCCEKKEPEEEQDKWEGIGSAAWGGS